MADKESKVHTPPPVRTKKSDVDTDTKSSASARSQKSTSDRNDQTKKMNESVPMEFNVPDIVVPEEKRSKFKNLLLKAAKKVGVLKGTQFSKEYKDEVEESDNYNKVINCICSNAIEIAQPNAKLVNKDFTKMEFEAPVGEDPFEKLAAALAALDEHFPNKEFVAANVEVSQNLAKAHRLYQKKVRHGLHHMRTFLNVDFPSVFEERRHLIACRQDLDFSYYDYTNNPTDPKRITYERSLQRFDNQLAKVSELLKQLKLKKEDHINEVISLRKETKVYHETCNKESQKLRKFRAQFEAPTNN